MKLKHIFVSILGLFTYFFTLYSLENLSVNFAVLWSSLIQIVLLFGLSFLLTFLLKISYKKYFALALFPQLFLSLFSSSLLLIVELLNLENLLGFFVPYYIGSIFMLLPSTTTIQLILAFIFVLIKRENMDSVKSFLKGRTGFTTLISGTTAVIFMILFVPMFFKGNPPNTIWWICLIGAPLIHFLIMFALEPLLTILFKTSTKQYYFWSYGVFIAIGCIATTLFGLLTYFATPSFSFQCLFFYMLTSCVITATTPSIIRCFISKVPYLWLKIVLNIILALSVILIGAVSYLYKFG